MGPRSDHTLMQSLQVLNGESLPVSDGLLMSRLLPFFPVIHSTLDCIYFLSPLLPQVPPESDQIDGQEKGRETLQSQAFHQSRELRPPPPYAVHAGAGVAQGLR